MSLIQIISAVNRNRGFFLFSLFTFPAVLALRLWKLTAIDSEVTVCWMGLYTTQICLKIDREVAQFKGALTCMSEKETETPVA